MSYARSYQFMKIQDNTIKCNELCSIVAKEKGFDLDRDRLHCFYENNMQEIEQVCLNISCLISN